MTAPYVTAMLRIIQARWWTKSRCKIARKAIPSEIIIPTLVVKSPKYLGNPPVVGKKWIIHNAVIAIIKPETIEVRPDQRCHVGQRRRTTIANWNGIKAKNSNPATICVTIGNGVSKYCSLTKSLETSGALSKIAYNKYAPGKAGIAPAASKSATIRQFDRDLFFIIFLAYFTSSLRKQSLTTEV